MDKKMDEIQTNYYGMLIYFGIKDFFIVTELKCHPTSEPSSTVTPLKKSKKDKTSKSPKTSKKVQTPAPKASNKTTTKTNTSKDKITNN